MIHHDTMAVNPGLLRKSYRLRLAFWVQAWIQGARLRCWLAWNSSWNLKVREKVLWCFELTGFVEDWRCIRLKKAFRGHIWSSCRFCQSRNQQAALSRQRTNNHFARAHARVRCVHVFQRPKTSRRRVGLKSLEKSKFIAIARGTLEQHAGYWLIDLDERSQSVDHPSSEQLKSLSSSCCGTECRHWISDHECHVRQLRLVQSKDLMVNMLSWRVACIALSEFGQGHMVLKLFFMGLFTLVCSHTIWMYDLYFFSTINQRRWVDWLERWSQCQAMTAKKRNVILALVLSQWQL